MISAMEKLTNQNAPTGGKANLRDNYPEHKTTHA